MTDVDAQLEALAARAWRYLRDHTMRTRTPVLARNDDYRWHVPRDTYNDLLRTDSTNGPIAAAVDHPMHVEPGAQEWAVRLFGIPVVPEDTDDTDLLLLVVAEEPDRD